MKKSSFFRSFRSSLLAPASYQWYQRLTAGRWSGLDVKASEASMMQKNTPLILFLIFASPVVAVDSMAESGQDLSRKGNLEARTVICLSTHLDGPTRKYAWHLGKMVPAGHPPRHGYSYHKRLKTRKRGCGCAQSDTCSKARDRLCCSRRILGPPMGP